MSRSFVRSGKSQRRAFAARSCITSVLLCSALVAHPAHAQQPAGDDASRAVARQTGVEGIDAFQANDFATADQKLERAYRLFPAPTLGLYSARTRVKLGLWVEAAERYRQATRSAPELADAAAQKTAQQEAAQELEALLPRIPTLTVVLEGANAQDVSITLGNAAYSSDLIGMARPTNPGTHRVVATRGSERVEQSVTLAEKDRKTVSLAFKAPVAAAAPAPTEPQPQPTAAAPTPTEAAATLAPQPANTTSTQPEPESSVLWPVGIATLSVGAVGLITWGVSSLIADGKLDKCPVDAVDNKPACETQGEKDSYDALKAVSTISFWSGAVLTLGGAGMLIWEQGRERSPTPSVSWGISPTGASVRGTF
jgi:hypothetical protein